MRFGNRDNSVGTVNLTAERDILNNTLEQTKRELNREIGNRSALENRGADGSGGAAGSRGGNGGSNKATGGKGNLIVTLLTMLIIAAAAFVAGVREAKLGHMDYLEGIPHIGALFTPEKPKPRYVPPRLETATMGVDLDEEQEGEE